MQIIIYDMTGSKTLASWNSGEYNGLTYALERPGGMLTASFNIPCKYSEYYDWARDYNTVEIYHEDTMVWCGYVYSVERFWGDTQGIKIDCVGDVARLAGWTISTDLSNEKASAYLIAHMVTNSTFTTYIPSYDIDTNDYTIPGVVSAQPRKFYRQMIDSLHAYNANAYDWYVHNRTFYWQPIETSVSYTTHTEKCIGSCRQELGEFANWIFYSYTDLSGVAQASYLTDSATTRPDKAFIEAYSGNMTSAQAVQAATESLNNAKVLGTTGSIDIQAPVLGTRGELIHHSEIVPGKLIRIEGLIPAVASLTETYIDNDIDTFRIVSCSWNDDAQVMSTNPGRMGYTIPVILARLAQ